MHLQTKVKKNQENKTRIKKYTRLEEYAEVTKDEKLLEQIIKQQRNKKRTRQKCGKRAQCKDLRRGIEMQEKTRVEKSKIREKTCKDAR